MSDTPEADDIDHEVDVTKRDELIVTLWEHVSHTGFTMGTEDYELMKAIVLATGVTEDEFVNLPPVERPLRAEIHQGDSGQFTTRLVGLNGEIVFTSETHPDRRDAVHAAQLAGIEVEDA